MDIYPITHKNLIFNIITDQDISFAEIRKLLDYLVEENAFSKGEEYHMEMPQMYEVYIDDYHYVVDVLNFEVAIYKREKKTTQWRVEMFRIPRNLIIVLSVICITAISCTTKNDTKPVLNLYVMSHCPFGIRAEDTIIGVMAHFDNGLALHIRYIVGKEDNNFTSLHGPPELDEDLHQIAIQELHSGRFYTYLLCYNSTMDRDRCLKDNNIDKAEIDAFVKSGKAEKILDADYNETEKLHILASPTLYINDSKYSDPMQPEHILRAVCAAIPGLAYCKTLKPPVDVNVTILTGGWENVYRPEIIKENLSDFFYKSTINMTDINSNQGKELSKKFGISEIPALLFSKNVTMTTNYNTIKARLRDVNGAYMDSMDDLGYRHLTNRPAEDNKMVMFLDVSSKPALNACISVLKLLLAYKQLRYTPVINVIGSTIGNETLKTAAIIGREKSTNNLMKVLDKLSRSNSLKEFNSAYHSGPFKETTVKERIAQNNSAASELGIGKAGFALLINNTELIDPANPVQSVNIFELSPIIGKQGLLQGKQPAHCAK